MMGSFLRARGLRVQIPRVRDSLRRVDPDGTELRAMANRTLRRRQYSVPAPNAMWHIDGNHKLIRWRFVVHGGIDGFSRLIVYLSAATNNRASTVLESFSGAVSKFGVPSSVRSDKGGENIEVPHYMVEHRGENRNSHITGRSVHNQRIGRLWRDVYTQVLDVFHVLFRNMEREGMLNPDDEVEADYGINWDGPYGYDDLGGGVQIPEVQLQQDTTEEDMARLPDPNVPFLDAVDIYSAAVQQLRQ
ncbi:uncharacterized protein [Labrus bergylta]|uniref:uncharacterized protein n=1 Tax=Labrus bergylta TaxID=56723 RepID=UPI003313CFBA